MRRDDFTLSGLQCTVISDQDADGASEAVLIQAADDHDIEGLEKEADLIAGLSGRHFTLAAFHVRNWNDDLSPWEAPPVFGDQGFGGKAGETLCFIENDFIRELKRKGILGNEAALIAGGYSLAAFFSLWASYQVDIFSAVAAASPSVWFPGWIEYAENNECLADHVYLSLGTKEEKARNPVMARVGECIRTQHAILTEKASGKSEHRSHTESMLEWNEGSHFRDPELRTARGFAWCLDRVL